MTGRRAVGVCASLAALAVLPAPAQAAPNAWRSGPDMPHTRTRAATATLGDGRVLMIGGNQTPVDNCGGPPGCPTGTSVDAYSPSSGTWAPVAPLVVPLTDPPLAATLTGGKVLAGTGGSAEVYDPAANTWTAAGNAAPATFSAIVALADGRALLVGGDSTAADIYDPADNMFKPAAAMREVHPNAGAAVLSGGKVLVAGGGVGGVGVGRSLATAEVYDPASNTWQDTGNAMPTPHIAPFMATLPDGKLLIAGTHDFEASEGVRNAAAVYDPATNVFVATGQMTQQHLGGTVVAFADGRVLLAGGLSVRPGHFVPFPTSTAHFYHPSIGEWLPSGPLINVVQVGAAAAALPNGEALQAGGSPTAGTSTAKVQFYTPATVPTAPRSVNARAGDGTAVASWDPPESDGGVPLRGYTVRASDGTTVSTGPGTTGATFSLPNGTPVSITVTATNALGEGASASSAAVTPTVPPTPLPPPAPTPPPPPPTPPTPDTTAPTVTVTKLNSKLKLKSFLKGLTATLTPSEPVALTVDLIASTKKATIAKTYNLALATTRYGSSAAARKLKLKPNKKLIGRARKFTVQLKVLAVDAAGNRRTVTKTIKVAR